MQSGGAYSSIFALLIKVIIYTFKLSKSFVLLNPVEKSKVYFPLRIGMILNARHICCEPWTVFMRPEEDLWKQPVIKITHAS